MTTTRAATFTAKIRNLKDYHCRMVNGVAPLPSGVDIANTLKYFSQLLIGVLKDVPLTASEGLNRHQWDNVRLAMFPNLNYSGLFQAVKNIIDIVPSVQYGQHPLGESVLNVIGCLVPFMESEVLNSLPYMAASTLAIFPASLHRDTVLLLCTNLLPVTLGCCELNDEPTYASESTAAILMLVFQYVTAGEYHSMLLECLMSLKRNICKDLLCVIAYGPPSARGPAVNHLFFYWPQLNPALFDKRRIHYKFFGFDFAGWKPLLCQREKCVNDGNVRAVKVGWICKDWDEQKRTLMCMDPTIASECSDHPPPLYVCKECVDQLRVDHSQYLADIIQPIENVSLICENKNCQSLMDSKTATCTCFAVDCASSNGFRPMRYCTACDEIKHANFDHLTHRSIPDIWNCEPDLLGYLVDAIVSLLKEAQPLEEKRMVEMGEERTRTQLHGEEEDFLENQDADERKLLSRYGIWLLVELAPPKEDIPIEILGHLLAMLFQWFDATAYLPDDTIGNALNRLKPEYVRSWLTEISEFHFEVVLSCLLPHPPEYAKVGGYCDTLASRTTQIKEGLNRLFCLIPYSIVNFQVWDYVMAFWLEAIRTEIPEEERHELKVLICKAFDTTMSPLSFGVEEMYHFITERFQDTTPSVQEQNLGWLQIMTSLETFIPVKLLLTMFVTGIDSMNRLKLERMTTLKVGGEPDVAENSGEAAYVGVETEDDIDNIPNLKCFVQMLDLIFKQVEIQNLPGPMALEDDTSRCLMNLLTQMLSSSWDGVHTCDEPNNLLLCSFCELSVLWYQLASKVISLLSSSDEVTIPVQELPKVDLQNLKTSEKLNDKLKDMKSKVSGSTESSTDTPEAPETAPDTRFLPPHLQLLHALLNHLGQLTNADAQHFCLGSLKTLCLHTDCMKQSENGQFLQYCLRHLMIPNLWKLLKAEQSHISSKCVPLLIYCLTQPTGADIFWKLIEDDFGSEDWRVRFAAVEKVTVLCRMLNVQSVLDNQQIKTSLAHAFCSLIGSLNDVNSVVVQRATLYLDSIKTSSIKCMCQCLEFQFDTVIRDRTMILTNLYLLSIVLKDHDILTWDLFLNRFDTLCLEAQLDLESSGDISSLQDLYNSDRQSDCFLRKINRARFALARTDSIRSVSSSFLSKPPYRRAASVPMHLLIKCLSPQDKEEIASHARTKKDKSPYTRQQSAPQFRSRGSKFGLGMFANYVFPGGHLREFTDGESNFAALLQRAMDLEGVDRETLHHLVTLLLKFMVNSSPDSTEVNKSQSIVLRHLNVLLGYNQTEKSFSVPPYKLRYSAVFNAYISGLAKVLDRNFELGNMILPVSLVLLQYCPSPQRYASDYQEPNFTLWYLEPHTRISWLQALLVILYKYRYAGPDTTASKIVSTLVRITVNTVDARLHQCKKMEDSFGPSSPFLKRNRDTSNVSVGDLQDIIETETPPQSPRTDFQTLLQNAPAISSRRNRMSISVIPDSYNQPPVYADPTPLSLPVSPNSSRPSSPVLSKLSSPTFKLFPGFLKSPFICGQPEERESNVDCLPSEFYLQQQQDQARRIAEYNRMSLVEVESDDANVSLTISKVKEQKPKCLLRPLLKRLTEPALKYNPFKQRTLSIELNELPPSVESPPIALPELPKIKNLDAPQEAENNLMADGTPEILLYPASPVNVPVMLQPPLLPPLKEEVKFESILEDVKESEEEFESPKRGSDSTSTGPTSQSAASSSSGNTSKSCLKSKKSVDVAVEGIAENIDQVDGQADVEALGKRIPTQLERAEQLLAESEAEESPASPRPPLKPNFRQRRKERKTGLTTIQLAKDIPEISDLIASEHLPMTKCRTRRAEMLAKAQQMAASKQKALNAMRSVDNLLVDHCPSCHAILESYDEDTISLSIVCLATFIHREPGLAAPMLLDMLKCVAKIAANGPFPWQSEQTGVIIPGNSMSVGRQFIRCVLHQLAPNNVFPQLFMSDLGDGSCLKTIAAALMDFGELNSYAALQLLLEGVNETKTISNPQLMNIVTNLATFLDCIILENANQAWGNILSLFDVFFRRLPALLSNPCDMSPFLKTIISILKIPSLASSKSILEPFSKLISFTIQNCSFQLQQLLDICSLCGRAFTKDRDKLFLSRCVVFELIQALKFKLTLPDENLILLVQMVCLDAGGTLGPINIVHELASYRYNPYSQSLVSTNTAECMKLHLAECIEFIADLHTINKVKNNLKAGLQNLNEDTLGSHLKAGIAQFIALEFTQANGRDNRMVSRYLPWLYHPPSAMQQGPREFIDCVGHIRVLCWLLLGSLMHIAVTRAASVTLCQPLSLEACPYIVDHIMVILTGFTEQSRASVHHMSSLFHAFMLCQLWTMYCESLAAMNAPRSEAYTTARQTVMDFWSKVTPGVLQLLSHSRMMSEMVNLHFLSLMEALQECNSTVLVKCFQKCKLIVLTRTKQKKDAQQLMHNKSGLHRKVIKIICKLFSLWVPILYSYHSQLPGHMQVRLQMCQNWRPKEALSSGTQLDSDMLLKWLKRLQFKLSQIEIQSSTATQFYAV